jgi:hypothetical protein
MAKQRANVMHEKGVQKLGDFLLVGKVKGPIEWNPYSL